MGRLVSLGGLLIVLAACSTEDPIPSLGETGGGDSGPPLPGGDDCGENWYAIDGPMIEGLPDGPEAFGGSLAGHRSRIEFTGPPIPPRVYEPNPVEPARAGMSFEQFVARYAEPSGNDWFIEGDQPITDADLRALYEQLHGQSSGAQSGGAQPGEPVPVTAALAIDGFDAAWSSGRKLALTWCVGRVMPSPLTDQATHDAHVARLVEAVEWATRAWERAGDVNFIHLAEYDDPTAYASGTCQPGQNGIFFRVRTGTECLKSCGGKTFGEAIAQYEFDDPDQIDGKPEIVFGLQRFFWSDTEARINALHELGHVLGFTHEHLRWLEEQDPNNDECNKHWDVPWRGLTPPDRDSIMGVDTCAGVNKNLPKLSAWDRMGAYYQYTWGRRRSAMMGLVSQVDDYAYDGFGQPGILWQTSRSAALERWSSTGAPGQPITFEVEQLCADGGAPPCDGVFDSEGRVRPSPVQLGSGPGFDLDVLFHGPGPVLPDSAWINDGLLGAPINLDLAWFSIPVIGNYSSGNGDQILLYRPGPEGDALLVIEDGEVEAIPMNFSGYAIPLAGRFRGFAGGRNDIIWYDPHENEVTAWRWGDGYEFDVGTPLDVESLNLDDGVEYVPVLGDFNGDAMTDIFWYSPGDGVDTMWWSESSQSSISFGVNTATVPHDYRPFVGDFDGNGVDDILWFASYAEAARVTSEIWYFTEAGTYHPDLLSNHRDYSPYVADFDDDGCSDILWYKPDDPNSQSPLWRCLPRVRDFACEPPLTIPAGVYPVGFGGAY